MNDQGLPNWASDPPGWERMLPPKKPQKPVPRDEGENPTDDDYFER